MANLGFVRADPEPNVPEIAVDLDLLLNSLYLSWLPGPVFLNYLNSLNSVNLGPEQIALKVDKLLFLAFFCTLYIFGPGPIKLFALTF